MFWYLFLLGTSQATTDISSGGSCGSLSVPYRMFVTNGGHPEISCMTPTCLLDGRETRFTANNLNINCEPFMEVVCEDDLAWTGGLLEVHNETHKTLKTECCSYPGLKGARQSRTVRLRNGEEVIGGMVENGRYTDLEIVKEVRKTLQGKHVIYVVSMVVIPCNQQPTGGILSSLSMQRSIEDVPRMSPRVHGMMQYSNRRRGPGRMRKPLRELLEEYYYYDDDVEIVRKKTNSRQRAPGRRLGGNSLWPIDFDSKPKQLASETYNQEEAFNTEDVVVSDSGNPAKMVAEDMSAGTFSAAVSGPQTSIQQYNTPVNGPVPPTGQLAAPNTQMLASQGSAPADTYVDANNYLTSNYLEQARQDAYQTPNIQSRQPFNQQPQPPQPQPVQQQFQQIYQPQQPAYQPAYAPAYPAYPGYTGYPGPSLNGIFDQMQCFSGDTTVITPAGEKSMKDLETGDLVLSMEENMVSFSPVIMFLHKIDDESAQFRTLQTTTGTRLKLTDYHLIYISNCMANDTLHLVPAKSVESGDCVYTFNEKHRGLNQEKIVSIEKLDGMGIYAPLTVSGDIFANGVLASCHSNLALKTLQQTFFSTYRRVSTVVQGVFDSDRQDLPFGVGYLTSVLDLFLPSSFM